MSLLAIRTIRIHNFGMTRDEARFKAKEFTDLINKKYPEGVEDETTYFVMPGFEHVTKHQPIAGYNSTEASWELYTTDLYLQPNT